jgi:hypothetical protein
MKLSVFRACLSVVLVCSFCSQAAVAQLTDEQTGWLQRAERANTEGWIYLHIEGKPYERGFQHGYLVAPEIKDSIGAVALYLEHSTGKSWEQCREASEKVFLPRMPEFLLEEIDGMLAGMKAAGVGGFDRLDIIAYNGWIELGWYYFPSLEAEESGAPPEGLKHGSCSAFIATGNATHDGRIVMAHNSWVDYMLGIRWNVILDLQPDEGYRFITQSFPGFFYGGTDFWINSAGLLVAETTISGFVGFDPQGVPEFVRIRRAVQFGHGIDSFTEIMKEGNNGGYANDWLIGDTKTGEIAYLELGLKNVVLQRTFDGYFVGCNRAWDAKVQAEETTLDYGDMSLTPNARWARWQQVMRDNYGTIDKESAKRFLADHYDTYTESYLPCARTLCGHDDLDPRGNPAWEEPPFYPGGATDGKVTDSEMAATLSLEAKLGHPCDIPFHAGEFLTAHPDFEWQRQFLLDMPNRKWATFSAKSVEK